MPEGEPAPFIQLVPPSAPIPADERYGPVLVLPDRQRCPRPAGPSRRCARGHGGGAGRGWIGPAAREAVLQQEILSGNVPEFWRQFVPITVTGGQDKLILQVSPDYLAVGREADFFQTPLTPGTAWRIADRLDCALPTRKMVDLIHAAAPLKLPPTPRPPGPA